MVISGLIGVYLVWVSWVTKLWVLGDSIFDLNVFNSFIVCYNVCMMLGY